MDDGSSGSTPAGSDRITPPAGSGHVTPTGVSGTTPGGSELQPPPISPWSGGLKKLKRLLAALGVTSVVSAVAFWRAVCPAIGLCKAPPPSFVAIVDSALREVDDGLRSEKISALRSFLSDTSRARIALPRLAAFVKAKRRRQPDQRCTPLEATVPGDVQAALTTMVRGATTLASPLLLDSLDLTGAGFRNDKLAGAQFNGSCLARAVFDSANLRGAHFRGAQLPAALFRGANLDSAVLEGAAIDSANFRHSTLIGADLSEARAVGADFGFARMPCVLLGNANLTRANFNFADLRWAYLGGATLGAVQNLAEADSVRHATFDGAAGIAAEMATALRDRGALLENVTELSWYQPRVAQFARDSVCYLGER